MNYPVAIKPTPKCQVLQLDAHDGDNDEDQFDLIDIILGFLKGATVLCFEHPTEGQRFYVRCWIAEESAHVTNIFETQEEAQEHIDALTQLAA